MYIHMCGHGCGRRRATHSKTKTKGPAAPQPWPQHHRGTVPAAMRKKAHRQAQRAANAASPRWARSTLRAHTQQGATVSGARLRHPPRSPNPAQPSIKPPCRASPPPHPSMLAGRARERRSGQGAVRGPWRGCWRELVVCVGGCRGGQMGLGICGHTRTDG